MLLLLLLLLPPMCAAYSWGYCYCFYCPRSLSLLLFQLQRDAHETTGLHNQIRRRSAASRRVGVQRGVLERAGGLLLGAVCRPAGLCELLGLHQLHVWDELLSRCAVLLDDVLSCCCCLFLVFSSMSGLCGLMTPPRTICPLDVVFFFNRVARLSLSFAML